MSSSPQPFTPEDPRSGSAAPGPILPERPVRSGRGVRGREFPIGLALAALVLAEVACFVFLAMAT